MVTLIVNPTVVTLNFTRNELDLPIVQAKAEDGIVLATFTIVHSGPGEGSRLFMRDNRTDIVYESGPIDKDDLPDINYLLERMLNEANLTHIQRIPNAPTNQAFIP